MIVDDDEGVLSTVALLLETQGFNVAKAPSGRDCLELLRRGFHGVILMDIMMPEMNGWQTIRSIVAEHLLQDNLICMLTAKAEPGPEGEGLQECVFDYLPKPFGPNQIACVVDHAFKCLAA